MYLAHSGVAMAATPVDDDTPLFAFLLASWSPDLTGVGHWLPGGVLLAAIFYVAGLRRWNARTGAALGALVLSHLVLDLVVGLQIWPTGPFLGLNLSTHSVTELALELAAICAGFAVYLFARKPLTPLLGAAFVTMVAFAVIAWTFADDRDVHDPSRERLAVEIAGLVVTGGLLVVADRRVRGRPDMVPST